MLGVGVFVFLQATSNGLIRLLLQVVGTLPEENQKLKGGRVIGPLERSLIWALGLAGHLAAAALVIAAKGLLRFPELSKEEDSAKIHTVTEYLLVGSLASWTIALACVAIVG